ncbi:MAG TPA: hypothetical protein EYP62_06855 [Kiritimatiellae bacterium]|nr:hypothetical protein [Kiritimatiellia bacterium]
MNYLFGYLAIGILVFLVVIGSPLLGERKESDFDQLMREADARLRKTWWDRLLAWIIVPLVAALIAVVAWPLVLFTLAKDKWWPREQPDTEEEEEFAVAREHLLQRRTIEEIEAAERVSDPLGAVPDLAFVHLNPAWAKFKENLRPDDELWSFSAPWKDWGGTELCEGYAIVRDREIGPWFIANRKLPSDPGD